jgi:hypothetical protein
MCRASFPEEYKRYRRAYVAGAWKPSGIDNRGVCLMRAIVWKSQVTMHRDVNDGKDGICMTFCAGRFESADERVEKGAYMVMPDLGLVFAWVSQRAHHILTDTKTGEQIQTRGGACVPLWPPLPRCDHMEACRG